MVPVVHERAFRCGRRRRCARPGRWHQPRSRSPRRSKVHHASWGAGPRRGAVAQAHRAAAHPRRGCSSARRAGPPRPRRWAGPARSGPRAGPAAPLFLVGPCRRPAGAATHRSRSEWPPSRRPSRSPAPATFAPVRAAGLAQTTTHPPAPPAKALVALRASRAPRRPGGEVWDQAELQKLRGPCRGVPMPSGASHQRARWSIPRRRQGAVPPPAAVQQSRGGGGVRATREGRPLPPRARPQREQATGTPGCAQRRPPWDRPAGVGVVTGRRSASRPSAVHVAAPGTAHAPSAEARPRRCSSSTSCSGVPNRHR